MNIQCVGISHRTAPIDIRERIWFSQEEIAQVLRALRDNFAEEAVLVSTCNRTELYYVPRAEKQNGEAIWRVLARLKNAEPHVT